MASGAFEEADSARSPRRKRAICTAPEDIAALARESGFPRPTAARQLAAVAVLRIERGGLSRRRRALWRSRSHRRRSGGARPEEARAYLWLARQQPSRRCYRPAARSHGSANKAHCRTASVALRRSASGRAGRRGSRGGRRLSRGARRKGRASGCRSTGRRRRTISAMRSRALGERESGTARLEEAVAAYRAALEEWTRERVPLDWAMTQNNLGNALSSARRAGERDGAARGGGRRLSRGARGMDARAGSARLGDDAEQSRQCALDARRAGERDGAARGGGRGLSRGAGGTDARAGSARLGDDAEQSRQCARDARRAGERDGAAGGGGRRLSRGAGGMDARAGSARLGDDAEQSRQRALERSASGRAGRRGSRRRSPPIARRWRRGRASGFRSNGRRASAIRGSP